MKLAQLARGTLAEGRVDPHILLTVQHAASGVKPNTFTFIVLARLLEMLRLGQFYSEPNFYEVTVSTPKATLDSLRGLEPTQLTALAQRLSSLLELKDKDQLRSYANPNQEASEWLRWVTSKEANN